MLKWWKTLHLHRWKFAGHFRWPHWRYPTGEHQVCTVCRKRRKIFYQDGH